ncbi:MAG TPA: hydrogenase maturation protease [Actinomycetes bacterium]|nr:hydrogenase maturation protease [Actinomycetes bacterium]
MTAAPRVLVAGVGNVFLGDDAFGVEVARRLAAEDLPDWVRVADFGIRGVHLAYELLEGYETAILVDAAPRGQAPGTVYVIEPDLNGNGPPAAAPAEQGVLVDGHGMEPDAIFALLQALGGDLPRLLVVGCEPAEVAEGMGLSAPVAGVVGEAVAVVRELIGEHDSGREG